MRRLARRTTATAGVLLVGASLALAGLATGAYRTESASPLTPCSASPSPRPTITGTPPARIAVGRTTTRHFEYVLTDGEIHVYDIDRANRLVQLIKVPQMRSPRGVAASPVTKMLYIACGGQGGDYGPGALFAYDLRRNRIAWSRSYTTGIDSMAITPDGRTIYIPVGEAAYSPIWKIVDASSGEIKGSIEAGIGAHNTAMGLDGRFVYLAGTDHPYLAVASTATNTVVREIGPLKSGGRPFTINGRQTLAFMTVRGIIGFQIGSIQTGEVLYTVETPGFTYDPVTYRRSPCHGISLSPDEKQVYIIDTPNGYVHVFDVSGVPASRPRHLADIKLAHPPPFDGWLRHSRDGRYVYVGRAGDVIDTRSRKIVRYLPPLQQTAHFIEIDWRGGVPVGTTSRYGLGYVRAK